MGAIEFTVTGRDPNTNARRGRLRTPHGTVETPIFMPVGTQAAVKGVLPRDLEEDVGAEIVLANTYHLYLRPGAELVAAHGGLHGFMGWQRPILTDSGGYQVFSLSDLRKLTEEGARFQSHIDGSRHMLSPELSMQVQQALGADIAMAMDVCPPARAPREEVIAAMERTTRWADRSLAAHTRPDQALFGIVQGGLDKALRSQHAAEIAGRPFDGVAIGGLSVGESPQEMWEVAAHTAPLLPTEPRGRPRRAPCRPR